MVLLKYEYYEYVEPKVYISTLHYGSIKILVINNDKRLKIKSTFHYGSIKIFNDARILLIYIYLHSTMVLLKLLI